MTGGLRTSSLMARLLRHVGVGVGQWLSAAKGEATAPLCLEWTLHRHWPVWVAL